MHEDLTARKNSRSHSLRLITRLGATLNKYPNVEISRHNSLPAKYLAAIRSPGRSSSQIMLTIRQAVPSL